MQFNPIYDPQLELDKRYLRSSAGFVGLLMLFLIITMNFTYLTVAVVLALTGFLPEGGIYQTNLGLSNGAYLCIYAMIYVLAMGLPLLLLLFTRHRFAKYPAKSISSGVVYFGVLAAMGVCMGSNVVTNILVAFLESIGIPSPELPQMLEPNTTSLVLNLFVMAVLPAILEELVFRFCVLRALRPFGDGFAVLVSAVLFGLMHGNIRQIPFALMVGLALGYLYVGTNRLWIPMLVHFMNNALSVCLEYIGFSMTENAVGWFYTYVIYGLALLGGLAIPLLFILYRRQLKTAPKLTRLTFGQCIGGLLKSPAFVIALVAFIILLIAGV